MLGRQSRRSNLSAHRLGSISGVSLPPLVVDTPVSLTWSSAGGGTATVTPPVMTPTPTGLTYILTVNGVPVTLTGLTASVPQDATPKNIQIAAIGALSGYSNTYSYGQFFLAPIPLEIVIADGEAYFTGNRTQINTTPTGAWWQNAA